MIARVLAKQITQHEHVLSQIRFCDVAFGPDA